MKDKTKNIIDKIFASSVVIVLIVSLLLTRQSAYITNIQVATLIISLLYIIIRIMQKEPIKYITNKLDILVLLFIVTPFVPIIAKTYVNLGMSVSIALNYITLYFWYILIREFVNRKVINIKNTSIFITILTTFIVLIGIENLTTNQIMPFLGMDNIINGEDRLVSFFGNPNILAVYLCFSFFIVLHTEIKSKKTKEKVFYNINNTMCLIGVILTYSKAIFIIMPIISVVYMFVIRNKKKNIEIIQNIFLNLCMSVIYINIFNMFENIGNYIFIWMFLVIILLIGGLISVLNIKIKEKIENIKIYKITIFLVIIFILIALWLIKELNNPIPYEVFTKNNTSTYEAKKINNIKGNTRYILKFDIKAKINVNCIDETNDVFEINIIERDKRNFEIKNTKIQFKEYEGIKEIEIITHEKTSEFKIEFKTKYQYLDRTFTINSLEINGEQIPLQYKTLPIKLVDKIKDINIHYKTAIERGVFIKDAITLAKENFLTGIGGECWQYKYGEIQEYNYISNDIHSYLAQVLLEFGIFSLILLVTIYIVFIKMKTDRKYLGLKIAMLIIMLHSTIDSDLKFQFIQLVFFGGFGFFSGIIKKKETTGKMQKKLYINIIAIIIALITIMLLINPATYNSEIKIEKLENCIEKSDTEYLEIERNIAKEYEKLVKYNKNNELENYVELTKKYMILNEEDKIEKVYYKIKEYKNKNKKDPYKVIEKTTKIADIIQTISLEGNPKFYKWVIKFAEIEMEERKSVLKELEKVLEEKYEKLEDSEEYKILNSNIYFIEEAKQRYALGIDVINETDIDLSKIDIEGDLNIKNKNILIYHTHGQEAYYAEGKYEETEYGKTLNENYNILKIGDYFKQFLQEKEYSTTQLREYYDIDGIKGAYDIAENKLKEYLKNSEKKEEIIFDIHRDAAQSLEKEENIIEIDGEKVAKLRFVIGTNHKKWQKNLQWAVEIQKKADELYPGLFKPMLIDKNYYNQNLGEYATLLEVGVEINSLDEAKNSMKYLTDVIKEIL